MKAVLDHIGIAVQDLDKTPMSRHYLETVSASLSFNLSALPTNMSPERVLAQNQARAALIIPPQFERDLRRGQNVEVQWLIDGTDANTANVMRGKAAAITQAFTAQIQPPTIHPAIKPLIRYPKCAEIAARCAAKARRRLKEDIARVMSCNPCTKTLL